MTDDTASRPADLPAVLEPGRPADVGAAPPAASEVAPGPRKLTPEEQARVDAIRESIDVTDAQMVLQFGRLVWARGAQIHALGRKEVQQASHWGLDLRPYAGLQVVCAPSGDILTVYRNHDFKRLRRAA